MPLTELSPNVRRHGSNAKSLQLQSQDVDSPKAPITMAPGAIQSMLRTATETGDIGQFSVRPSRVPRSASRIQLARPRSGSFDSSFGLGPPYRSTPTVQGRLRRTGPRQMRSFQGLPRQDTIRSGLTSYHQNPRSRMRGPRRQQYGSEGIASPSFAPHTLHTHRSLMTLRSQRDNRSMHSNSPLAAQLRRPRHRATSPAFSDAYSYNHGFRPPYSRAGSVGTMASSPSSVHPARRGFPGYTSDMNHSFTSFARLPSPAIPLSYAGTARSQYPSRTSTPVSFRDARGASTTSVNSGKGLPRSPTESSTPQYYDYSESFVEEDCFSPDGSHSMSSLPFNIDQTILEHGPPPTHRRAQTPFGTLPGSTFRPSELPTNHNRRASENSKHSQGSKHQPPAVIPDRVSSVGASIVSQEQVENLRRASVAETVKTIESGPSLVKRGSHNSEERDARRVSLASRRTVASSPSSFFQSASRSPRDLTSLAARVHSPTPGSNSERLSLRKKQPKADTEVASPEKYHRDAAGPVLASWQLPTFEFRPFSWTSNGSSNRPRTSAGIMPPRNCPAILSPTPERPMSSQSRKRFSKILEIEDDYAGGDEKTGSFKRSFNSLNFSNLRRVDEIPESNYPPRYSIPPFSPPKSIIENSEHDNTDPGKKASPNAGSSQHTSHERSTIESLLDRHIESLGLMPEKPDEHEDFAYQDEAFISNSTLSNNTIRPSAVVLGERTRTRSSSEAIASGIRSSIGSSGKRQLVPRRLFASLDITRSDLPSFQSAPMLPGTAWTVEATERPPYGWQSLASTSQLNSMASMGRQLDRKFMAGELAVAEEMKFFKVRRRSRLSISLTSSSGWSQKSEDSYLSAGADRRHQRTREEIDRMASHRRRMRIRLKLKRNSQSLASIAGNEFPKRGSSLSVTQAGPPGLNTGKNNHLPEVGPAELDSRPVSAPHRAKNIHAGGNHEESVPSRIPHRWSSLIGQALPVKRSIDVSRKPSIRTIRSHPSVSSLAEPINSTRFASQGPHIVSQMIMLAPPDLGLPLHASTLDLTIPYAEVPSTIRPTLRETRSFFSDDSSSLPPQLGNSRKRFNMHSLRSAIPTSPKEAVNRILGSQSERNQAHVHHSCQEAGRKSFDENAPLDGTVGMSDFAYRKRKMIQRLKEWWMRQCMQKKLALKRKKWTA